MWTRIAKPALKKRPKKIKKTRKTLRKSPKSKILFKKTKNKPKNNKIKTILRRKKQLWPPTETSLEIYEELLDRGYDKVTFVAHSRACNICRRLNGKTWDLDLFIDTTEYDAPLFSRTHPGSRSHMKVWDSTGELPSIMVDYQGNMS